MGKEGKSARYIAKHFKTSKTQVQSTLKRKEEIESQWDEGVSSGRKILHPRRCIYHDINDQIYRWFLSARSKNIPVSGPMIQEEAQNLARKLGYENFTASNGWLFKFQKRNNISSRCLAGESAEISATSIDDWFLRIEEKCEGYSLKDIFNCDETGLFFRVLPKHSLVLKGDKCNGSKYSKERLTVLLACSAEGEKLTPLVIGKSKNPRCFGKRNHASLGVEYTFNGKAWMTRDIFTDWLKRLNNKMLSRKRKILLLLDNCRAHPNVSYSNLKLIFLPPNTSSRLQPLDVGIIQTMKLKYRKCLLHHVSKMIDSVDTVGQIAKKVSTQIHYALLNVRFIYLMRYIGFCYLGRRYRCQP